MYFRESERFLGEARARRPLLNPALYLGFGLFQVPLVGNVVALEYAPGSVPGNGHGHLFRDAVASHVADTGSPEVVEEQSGRAGRVAGFRPVIPKVGDMAAVLGCPAL